jgi:hypothetical protein
MRCIGWFDESYGVTADPICAPSKNHLIWVCVHSTPYVWKPVVMSTPMSPLIPWRSWFWTL